MAHLLTFSTAVFDIARETPNPINPIAGEGLLQWFRDRLAGTPYTATEPQPEDWGWSMDVSGAGASYLVGASGEPQETGSDVQWTIQVHRHRTLRDKITGANKLTAEDPLVAFLEDLANAEPGFHQVLVEREDA